MLPRAKRGGRKTPAELDFLFDRHLVTEDQYKEFWPRWWNASESTKEDIINEYLEEAREESPFLPLKGIVTQDREVAERQATTISGYVVRRDRTGRFNRKGRFYQAIKRKGKKSNAGKRVPRRNNSSS